MILNITNLINGGDEIATILDSLIDDGCAASRLDSLYPGQVHLTKSSCVFV